MQSVEGPLQIQGRRLVQSLADRISTPHAAIGYGAFLLFAFVLLACFMIWQSYSSALRTGEAKAESSAQIVAAHLEWMMEASDQALRRIDSALGPEPIRSTWTTIWDIRSAVGDLPEGFQYSVYDEAGRLRLSSVPEAIGIDVSDRDYFRKLKAGETVMISPQLDERLSGEKVFVVARRISRNQQFHGAASIAIPTAAMDEFWSKFGLGPLSTVTVIRTDGLMVARHPQLTHAVDFSTSPLFTKFLPSSSSGVYHAKASVADGIPRIVGYQKIDGWPIIATVGVERHEALAGFRANLIGGLTVGLPTALAMAIGTLWIASLLHKDADRRGQLEIAVERNSFLLREIHHRVKNNLQAVASLIRLQPIPADLKADISRRIESMVAVHEQIYGSDQFDRIDLVPYVRRLVSDIAKGFPEDVEVEFDLAPLSVERERGVAFGLLVSEVVTNAFKYAFKGRKGRLIISLKRDGEQGQLVIHDDGAGFAPEEVKQGMGTKLIAGFAMQVGGTLAVDASDGTKVTVTFPLTCPQQKFAMR